MKIPGLSFSWKRAIGITQAKQKLARQTNYFSLSARCVVTSAIVVGLMFLSPFGRTIASRTFKLLLIIPPPLHSKL